MTLRAFQQYPICRGSIVPKWFGLRPRYIWHFVNCNMFYNILYSIKFTHWLQATNFSVFIAFFSSHSTKHNWCHNPHNHGHRWQKRPPSAPHEALRSAPTLQMDEWHPPQASGYIFGGCWGCVWPLNHSFVPAMIHCHNIWVFWGPYTPSTPQKIMFAYWGLVAHPSDVLALSAKPHVGC